MIEVSTIIRGVLYNLGEMYARKHSDPEIIEAINSVLRSLNMILINRESNWIIKETTLKVKNGKATLPEDFAKIKSLFEDSDDGEIEYSGTYRVVRNLIYMDESQTMDYYYTVDNVEAVEDEIDLPSIFLEIFIRYTTGLLDGTFGTTNLESLLNSEMDALASADNYPVIERPMQFYV